MLEAEEAILRDRSACLRALWALKAGRAPREGVRYLSVGLDGTIQRLQKTFKQAEQGTAQILWLIGDYGEGKSHLLRLVTALAEEHVFAWAYVVHDKNQNIGLHKPAQLFRRFLFELQWNMPELNVQDFMQKEDERLSKYYERFRPYYPQSWQERAEYCYDRDMRSNLPKRLAEIASALCDYNYCKGLVLCLDELENCCCLAHNQHRPAFETLAWIDGNLYGNILICFALTINGLEQLQRMWARYVGSDAANLLDEVHRIGLTMPDWSEKFALPLAGRIHRLHCAAFGWEPTVSVEEVAMEASEQARATQSGRWRIFVQAVVNALERAHQKAIVPQPVATKPPETVPAIPKTLPTLPVLVSSPKPSLPKIHPGDRVEIVRTQFRGFRGIVEAVKDNKVEVVLDGRTPIRIKLPLDAIKKLR
jgi:transcription antitermination factor NusG